MQCRKLVLVLEVDQRPEWKKRQQQREEGVVWELVQIQKQQQYSIPESQAC
jgi:hypothetical protein